MTHRGRVSKCFSKNVLQKNLIREYFNEFAGKMKRIISISSKIFSKRLKKRFIYFEMDIIAQF